MISQKVDVGAGDQAKSKSIISKEKKSVSIHNFRVQKGDKFNYVSYGEIRGSYYIQNPKNLYTFISTSTSAHSYTFADSIKTDYYKMYFDIDMKEKKFKKHNISIKRVKMTNHIISTIVMVMNDSILEKEKLSYIYCDKQDKSSGIHLYYPDIIISTDYVKTLIDRMRLAYKMDNKFMLPDNLINDIFDTSVYGNGKGLRMIHQLKDNTYYKINKRKSTYKNIPIRLEEQLELLSLNTNKDNINFSALYKNIETTKPTNMKKKKHINKVYIKELPEFKTDYVKSLLENKDITEDMIKDVLKDGIELLGKKRYKYESWLNVGILCYYFGQYGIDQWISFSKRSHDYNINEINNKLNTFYYRDDGLKLNSLFKWVNEDNPSKYKEYIDKHNKLFTALFVNKITELERLYKNKDIGYVEIYYKEFCDKLVCCSESSKSFYLFNNKNKLWEDKTINFIIGHYMTNMIKLLEPLVDYYKQNAIDLNKLGKHDDAKIVDNNANKIKYNDAFYKTYIAKQLQIHILARFYKKNFYTKLNSIKYLLPVKNGVVNLKTGGFRERVQSDMFSFELNVEWKGLDYNTDNFNKFMNDIMLEDKELIRYIQKLLGYSITGYVKEQLFIILWGKGGNGKGVLMDLLKKLMGPYSKKVSKDVIIKKSLETNAGAATPHLISLLGLRQAFIDESEFGDKLNEGIVKELSGGDDIIARALFKDEITFEVMFQLFLLTNHKPEINVDEATIRRIKLIPFLAEFKDKKRYDKHNKYHKLKDNNIREDLMNNLEELLTWLIIGSVRYFKEGLEDMPNKVEEETKKYLNENDSIGDLITEYCKIDINGFTYHKKLYDIYLENYDTFISKKLFTKKMNDRGYKIHRKTTGTGFKGLQLK